MSEQIESQIISRRKLFWLAATTVALSAPITVLATSNARAQTPPMKKTKKKKSTAPSAPPAPAPAQPKQQ
jgi:hypothetical protein